MIRQIGGRAVVLGASLAGLLAARVLADAYGQVTVIDRCDQPVPYGRSGGLGNLGVVLRNGRSVYSCKRNSTPQTARNATTPPATATARTASATCSTSTTMAAARAASTVATMVGVLTRKWGHSPCRLGRSTM